MKTEHLSNIAKQIQEVTSNRVDELDAVLRKIEKQVKEYKQDDAGLSAIIECKNHCSSSIDELRSVCDSDDDISDPKVLKARIRSISTCARSIQHVAHDIYRAGDPLFYRLYQPDDTELMAAGYYETFQPYFAAIFSEAEALLQELEDIRDELDDLGSDVESGAAADLIGLLSDKGGSIQPCGPAVDKSHGKAIVNVANSSQVAGLFASALGGNPNPNHLRGDPTALTEHRERLFKSSFELQETIRNGRTIKKVVPISVRKVAAETQLYGSAAVTYQYFHHCFTEVKKTVEWLEPEICECDEELIMTLRAQTIICMETLVEEIRRPGGPIRSKVELQSKNLVDLIGDGKHVEGELIEMLGIDVERRKRRGSHRIELSRAMQERNSRAVIMMRRWSRSLIASLYELIDDCGTTWELPQLLGTTADIVTEIKQEIACAGISRTEVPGIEVIDWMDEVFLSELASHQVVSELRSRELIEIGETAECWLDMIDVCIRDDVIAEHVHLKKGFKRLRRYVHRTEMVTHVAAIDVEKIEAAKEKRA